MAAPKKKAAKKAPKKSAKKAPTKKGSAAKGKRSKTPGGKRGIYGAGKQGMSKGYKAVGKALKAGKLVHVRASDKAAKKAGLGKPGRAKFAGGFRRVDPGR